MAISAGYVEGLVSYKCAEGSQLVVKLLPLVMSLARPVEVETVGILASLAK